MKRRDFIKYLTCGCCGMMMPSCSSTPITKRKQLKIYPESVINANAAKAYSQFKKKAKLSKDIKTLNMIKRIGSKMEKAITYYFANKNLKDPTKNFKWEYILVDDDKTLNAWCMPGGKIAVYTGILKVTKNEDGLANVMGHEIAHAVAKHSVERASASMVLNVGTLVVDIFTGGAVSKTRNTVGKNTGVDILQVGVFNPFTRKQESEADYLGLAFASLTGYNLYEGAELWKRMKEEMGSEIPQFLSTHPSPTNRIRQIRNWIPQIRTQFPRIKNI
ncbi:MAG: M48 family metallopeptidase [Pelagibacteraceae bacterium]|jgi:predicted Zn-dependent protease|nr:M48 family metallopeptidase [Pelagibacteraceae bacterium]MCI5079204.1 M48 family metallopeptidase [Pelagibacteraceae bacterium]